jgi:hypothetical protein
MVERRVEDQPRRMTPPLIGSGTASAFFTEEDLQAAFPRTKNVHAGIDFGDLTLLAEVVTTQVALPTRENADVAAFNKDIEKFFLKKARQLDETAANLLRDPQPEGSLQDPARRILPVAVRGGQFPINPITRRHIEDARQHEGLLNRRRPAGPIARVAPLDLEELESARRCSRHATCPASPDRAMARNPTTSPTPRSAASSAKPTEGTFPGPHTCERNSPGLFRSSRHGSAATGRSGLTEPDSETEPGVCPGVGSTTRLPSPNRS